MSWREKTIVAILLIVARMLVEDDVLSRELKALANHISVWAPKEGDS